MLDRKAIEKREYEILSPFACKSAESKGRLVFEEECDLRTCFQRDRDRIVHSKAYRRLMHKTQVFLAPEGDHYRTRLTHTIEVAQISRTIARALGLNEDLTEAIALGHDLGHTPFGHNGERMLNELYPKGFRHNVQSLRVVDVLEEHNGRPGMNLTKEVRDGILNHNGKGIPFTLEGQIVKTSDRIAYINHDIDDALRGGVITTDQLPRDCISLLGRTHGERIDALAKDMIIHSDGQPRIMMSDEATEMMNKLRNFMFENVYYNEKVKRASDVEKADEIVTALYNYYAKDESTEEWAKDYIAGMTDRYAASLYEKLFS